MKNIIRIVSVLVKVASIILGLSAYAQALPPQYAAFAVISFAAASATKEIGVILCDYLDDGVRNGSYKLPLLIGLLVCVLLIPACGTAPGGQKTFIGATGPQWFDIGKGMFMREAPVVYGQVRQAREVTSAKEPVGVVEPLK